MLVVRFQSTTQREFYLKNINTWKFLNKCLRPYVVLMAYDKFHPLRLSISERIRVSSREVCPATEVFSFARRIR